MFINYLEPVKIINVHTQKISSMKSILISSLVADMKLQGFYLCLEKKSQKKKDGSTYLNLLLQDKSGLIRARIWNNVQRLSRKFDNGDPVAVKGVTYKYGESIFLKIDNISRADEKKYSKYGFKPSDLIPISKKKPNDLWKELQAEVNLISKSHLKKITKNILRDHKNKFKIYPASISYHYNYQNGLIEQTVSLLKIAKEIGSHYNIDIDLLVSGVCLHQIGKLYSINLGSEISKASHKSLVGNAILSRDVVNKYISEVDNFPEDDKLQLEHLILSYQGRKEWQSPVEPQTLEAVLLHSINFLDSKINFMRRDEL